MKKYLLMLLAATSVSLAFTSCSKDDKEEEGPQTPELIKFEDYSSAVDMTVQAMLKKYGEPAMSFGGYYMYTYETGNVSGLTFIVNEENNQVYSVMEALNDNAYKAEDIQAYFADKYTLYSKSMTEAYEEEGIAAMPVCIYGNAKEADKATLVITVTGNVNVTYINPKNEPAPVEAAGFDDITPTELVMMFYGQDIEDVLDEYGDTFTEIMPDVYMAVAGDNAYMDSFTLNVEEGFVTSFTILFNDGLEEDDIFNFYRENGYTVTATGNVDEEDFAEYLITNGVISVLYQGYVGRVSVNLDED